MFVWPLPPDGTHGLELKFEYATNVITSWRGEEQRNATRANPRLTIEFTDWRAADEAREMRRYFHNRLQKTTDANDAATEDFLMPILTEAQVVFGVFNSGHVVLFDNVCRYTGTDIVNYLTNGIDSILGTFTFQANSASQCAYGLKDLDGNPLAATIAAKVKAGWLSIPCLPVRFTPSVTRKVITSDITESKMTFPVSPGKFTMPALSAPPDRPNHPLDRELFDFPINISTPIDVTMLDNSTRVDYGRADPAVFHNTNYISETYKIGMTFYSKTEIEAFVDFYRRHEGRKRAFYWPSNEFDFIVAGDVDRWTGNGIKVKGLEAVDIFYHRDVRDANGDKIAFEDITTERIEPNPIVGIAIWYNNGWVTNIVDTVQVIDDCAYIVCKYDFPEFDPKHPLTDQTRISILHQARFATDEMTVRYSTTTIAEISTGIQTIPDEGYRRNAESD